MTSLERRLSRIAAELSTTAEGPSYADSLREALQQARERRCLGLPRDDVLPTGTYPLSQHLRQAIIRSRQTPGVQHEDR